MKSGTAQREGHARWGILAALALMLVGIATLALPAGASAQQSDDERARAHFMAGRSYMEQARYEDAAEQFQEAYRLSRRPEMLLNAATAHERALRFDSAIGVLEQYLSVQPQASDRVTIEERITRLRELLERSRAAEEEPAPQPEPTVEESTEAPVESAPPVVAPEPSGDGIGDLGIAGIALGSAGAASLVASLVTGLVAHDQYESLRARCGDDGRSCPPGSSDDISTGDALALTSTVTMFGGIALLGTGVALLVVDLTSGSSSESESTARVRLVPGPGTVGLAAEGSF